MQTVSTTVRFFSFLILFTYSFSSVLFAEAVSGQIESVQSLSDGQIEIVLLSGKEKKSILLLPATQVESVVPANKVKTGSRIRWSEGGGGGRRGFKSPFAGIPKGMRKSMGLPNIPETPDIPGRPELPSIPKTPKVPTVKGSGGGEASAEEGQAAQGRRKTQPPAQEPTEEEKSLFGKGDSSKPLVAAEGGKAPIRESGRKVLSVEASDKGVKITLEGEGGKQQQITLPANKKVTQEGNLSELQKNMKVEAVVAKAGNVSVAQRVKILE